ncbi:TetR/AcrR family transcriptional regulator [Alteribacillus sp. HJP-4]|uniref:TetR/AcrR family transcriptional regulator n=1 Tax=Alteribacillus sp. HJP-4 TaxID=2775394 RepID=UPI0035CD0776
MTKYFEKLDDEKKKRILQAALQEFAENGYEKASTNRIVKNAGIGKGMLFYYFKNKNVLYHYLIDYSLKIAINNYIQHVDETNTDFIERMRQATYIKMKAFAENPWVFNFLGSFLLLDEKDMPEKILPEFKRLQKLGYSKVYGNIDYSLFREGIDVTKAFNLIRWSIEGYQEEIKAKLKGRNFAKEDIEPLWEEFFEYLEILKKCYYKDEEGKG